MTIMLAIVSRHMPIEYLNFFSTFGTSMKKFENSTSLDVAPHDTSISNMWQRSACETCSEMPPKKIMNMSAHLKFSMTSTGRALCACVPVWSWWIGGKRGVKTTGGKRRVRTYTTQKTT
jgi:hypothetical protein